MNNFIYNDSNSRILRTTLEQLLTLVGHLHRPDLTGKSEQVDKALRVMVVIQVARGEGSNALIV